MPFSWSKRCSQNIAPNATSPKRPSPAGGTKVKSSKGLRFVVQEHAAPHLHYDLRLELDGVFKSWAVTKGPSLDPHDKRLAVEVEDHPLDYGDFEGTIPKGQYGGGTVMVWDRGHWNCEDPKRAYRKGKLDFTVEGEKLHGGWILTRMRKREGEKRINWLLIKHHDEFAGEGKKNTLLHEDTSVASGRSMDEITAGKGRGPKPFVTAKKPERPQKPNGNLIALPRAHHRQKQARVKNSTRPQALSHRQLPSSCERLPVIANAERRHVDGTLLFTAVVVIKATDRRRYERQLVDASVFLMRWFNSFKRRRCSSSLCFSLVRSLLAPAIATGFLSGPSPSRAAPSC